MTHKTLDEYLKQITTTHEPQSIIKQPTAKNEFKIVGFYNETEFKRTPIGKIPKEWKAVKLGQIVDVYDSKRIPLSERERANRKGPYPYCGANGIIDYIDDYIFDGEYLLLAEDGGYYGPFEKSAYIMTGRFWVNNHAHVLKAKEEIALNKFLIYMLNFLDLRPYLVGSTRTKLNLKDMKRITLPLPPLEEQWGIAEVLSSVDEAIEATGRLIGRLERLKRGLMQELLTKGIGHKEYKRTPIGKIPTEWKIVSLADVAEYINGYPFKPSEWSNNGLPIVRIQNLNDPSKPFNYYNGPLLSKHREVIINNGDLLFAWSASFGFYIWNRGRAILNQHIYKVKYKYSIIDKYFLYYIGNYYINVYVKTHAVGSTMKHIRKSTLKSIRIPLPPLEEQKRIVVVLSTIDDWIELERKRREKLERLKRGLMELLLTGRVRVRVERLGGEENLPGSGGGASS